MSCFFISYTSMVVLNELFVPPILLGHLVAFLTTCFPCQLASFDLSKDASVLW